MSTDEPILIRCEGSGLPGNKVALWATSCQMCAATFFASPVPEHQRQDILAMIDRGDFTP